ncbi:MAG: GTP-binding protein [Gammaproteobacteria bacterium]|nr:GTP-binding protein [Gammaproteobacteria bacterium]MBQ0839369.1 GTP-binding protein [Gammaproteobacteria bacterium]
MNSDKQAILSVPTNIITGFLGVGKTTAILHLLKQKPADERWAVLVNEFGEVGIDGSLFYGTNKEDQGIYIREVPGGCMCCAAGLPMQVALNMLLARARPQRLLIEPTGLGHPKEVLDALRAEHYRSVLDLRATLTLVDARKVQIERYTDHDTFNQQLEIADVIVANKADQYQSNDFPALLEYLENKQWLNNKPVHQLSMGQLQPAWLQPPSNYDGHNHNHPITESIESSFSSNPELPPCGYLSINNQGEGLHSQGWIFKPTFIFNRNKLYEILTGINAERVKGVFITDQGVIAYNKADNVLTEIEIDDAMDSRIECIAMTNEPLNDLEQNFLSCLNH